MKLDKTSERVLKHIIKMSNNFPGIEVRISNKNFIMPKLSNMFLISVCRFLYDNGYLTDFRYSYSENDDLMVMVSYKGYAYFEYKKIKRIQFIKQLLISKVSDIIVAAITAYITVLLTS